MSDNTDVHTMGYPSVYTICSNDDGRDTIHFRPNQTGIYQLLFLYNGALMEDGAVTYECNKEQDCYHAYSTTITKHTCNPHSEKLIQTIKQISQLFQGQFDQGHTRFEDDRAHEIGKDWNSECEYQIQVQNCVKLEPGHDLVNKTQNLENENWDRETDYLNGHNDSGDEPENEGVHAEDIQNATPFKSIEDQHTKLRDKNKEKEYTLPKKSQDCKTSKFKRYSYSIHDKLKSIDRVHNGESPAKICKDLRIPGSTLRGWVKGESNIRKHVGKMGQTEGHCWQRVRGSASTNKLCQTLYEWFVDKASLGMTITTSQIQTKAEQLHQTLCNDGSTFKPSAGWVWRFKKRYGLIPLSKRTRGPKELETEHGAEVQYEELSAAETMANEDYLINPCENYINNLTISNGQQIKQEPQVNDFVESDSNPTISPANISNIGSPAGEIPLPPIVPSDKPTCDASVDDQPIVDNSTLPANMSEGGNGIISSILKDCQTEPSLQSTVPSGCMQSSTSINTEISECMQSSTSINTEISDVQEHNFNITKDASDDFLLCTKNSTRKSYSVTEKLNILNNMEINQKNLTEVSQEFNVAHSTLRSWVKDKAKLQQFAQKQQVGSMKKCRMRNAADSALEDVLVEWVKKKQQAGHSVSGLHIRAKAQKLHKSMNMHDHDDPSSEFMASQGWLHRFLIRYGVTVGAKKRKNYMLIPGQKQEETEEVFSDDDLNTYPAFNGRFVCHHCAKRFQTPGQLSRHEILHLDKDLRAKPDLKHMCHHCGKLFANQSNLNAHEVIHRAERPYQCPYSGCDKSFKLQPVLKQHLKTHTK